MLWKANALNSWVKSDKRQALAKVFAEVGNALVGAAALLLGLAFLAASAPISARSPANDPAGTVRAADLPKEARQTLVLIKQGGPFPYARDGATFANREGRLPRAPRGTYREYTVKTPGSRDRGARRIIAAGSNQFWYTADHYRSFRRIVE
jgi:ribonuclease T1